MTDPAQQERAVRFHHSAGLPELLVEAGSSLLVSTYQAGQLIALGVDAEGKLDLTFRGFDQAMGVAVGEDSITVGARGQVWTLREHSELVPALEPPGRYDRCYLPRTTVVTGSIQVHEMAWGTTPAGAADLWVVNTAFSCLVGLSEEYNFVPRWRPPFISELAAGDRCHLNGMAMRDGVPAYVTVMARTDEPGGWRAHKNDGGTILAVPSGQVITTGLAMPHSPRWHDDHLWVLNSGWGRLERVDVASGGREIVALLPGFTRGLAFARRYAFVGLSRVRETAIFGGMPLAPHHEELRCGLGVVDLTTGATVATLEFTEGVEEIFDVQVVASSRCVSLGGSPNTGDEIWLVPGNPA